MRNRIFRYSGFAAQALQLAVALFSSLSSSVSAQELLVQADPWCPYNCQPDSTRPGTAIEILKAVFEHHGVKIRYEVVPWERALAQVREGSASAAVAVTPSQAQKNGLLIGREPVGATRDCLYVAASNPLKFSRADDLNALRMVAIVSGYSYEGEFKRWLERTENRSKIVVQRGDIPAEINAKNLAMGRLDGVIENDNVMQQIAVKLGLKDKLMVAGCEKQAMIFIAFSPKLTNAQQRVKELDDGVADLRRNGQLASILARYGQSNWK